MKTLDWSVETLDRECNVTGFFIFTSAFRFFANVMEPESIFIYHRSSKRGACLPYKTYDRTGQDLIPRGSQRVWQFSSKNTRLGEIVLNEASVLVELG